MTPGDYIAILALVVSAILGYREIKRSRRQIVVSAQYLYLDNYIVISATNIGHRTVTIDYATVRASQKGRIRKKPIRPLRTPDARVESEFPIKLEDGENTKIQIYFPMLQFLKDDPSIIITAVVRDTAGKEYTAIAHPK